MKRSVILMFLLLLSGGIYYLLDRGDDEKMTQLKSERAFALEDVDILHKVIITEKNKKPVILERIQGGKWQLNSKYLARKNAMDNLIEVIQKMQIKYIPEQVAAQNIFDEMRTIGVQVDLYAQENKLIKSYMVGGSTQDERGTYMMMNSESNAVAQPFVLRIPSIEGSVRGRFILSEIDWRDRAVVNEDVSNLGFVKVVYPGQEDESFIIKILEEESSLYSSNNVIIPASDKIKIKAYTQGFDNIYAEFIDNQNPLRDSISSLTPFSIISYGDSETDHKVLKLYPLSDIMYENDDPQTVNSLKVGGRYFVDCSWGDFMLVQHRLIGKLLRGKSFFEQK